MFVHGDSWSWIVLYLFLSSLTKDIAAQQIKSPAADFRRHRLVQPVLHHGRTKREITSTRHTEGLHHPEVTMTLNIEGEEHILDLRLNEDLVAGDHTISYQKDGQTVLHKPTIEELDICQYSGSVRGNKGSWVAVSTCRGVRGVIHDGNNMRYIEPAEDMDTGIGSKHFVYDHSDLTTNFHCGSGGGVTNNTQYDPELMKRHLSEKSRKRSRATRYKRDTSEDTEVRGPFNVNKQSRYVELVLVADNGEYRANGESIHTVHRQLKDVANIINSVYAPLNIFIALVGVVVWTEQDRIRLEDDGDATLTHFLTYRRETLLNEIPNDNAHLLTRKKFKDGVVGKALKGPICTYQYSGGVASNHSEVIGLVATTIAHEMGHNFGMEHDTETDCKCQDDKCIMSPSSTSITPTHWSDCSLRSLALSFERGMDYCLRNKPKRLFDSPTCGNGFVEPGEQCDCGLRPDAACAACCDPLACVLRSNATCASGECCDPLTCRPKSPGTVCRSAERECDLPEYCTGHSEFCPKDVHKMDATPCSNDQAYCVQGSCRTHTDQCRLLWGSTGSSSDRQCYDTSNIKGDKKGNCGYRRGTEREPAQYYRCASEDAMCGLLQCRHLNERLEYGMETVATLCAAFINNNGTIIVCRTAMLDMGTQDVDPGMVPDGAKCGEDKMCLKQKCVSVGAVRAQVARLESSVCPSNCSGHGVCNSEGHCHCNAGFAPPLCALPGPGGSIDSGPASDSSIQRNFMVAMYIIFLGILPSILLVLFLLYYSRHNVLLWWKKPRKTYVPRILNGGSKNFKFNFTISSSSLVKKLSFKRNTNHTNVDIPKSVEKDENIYENVAESEHDYESLKSNTDLNRNTKLFHRKVFDIFHGNPKKGTVKKFHRKINKEDIKVADSAELESVKNRDKFLSNNTQDKVDTKITKANLVIVKTGLASTTNENIKVDVKSHKNASKLNTESKSLKKDVKTNKDAIKLNKDNKLIKVHDKSHKNANKLDSNSTVTNKNIGLNNNKSNNDYIVNTGLNVTTNGRVKDSNIAINRDEQIPTVSVKDLRNKFGQTSGPHIDIKNLPKRSDLRKVNNVKM